MTLQRTLYFNEDAYAQGKMLNHDGWKGALPRRSMPSDVDMVFDNLGKIIFGELSRFCTEWREVGFGQRLLYENMIQGGAHCAVLCRHSVSTPIQIDTRNDIDSFQIMLWDYGLVYSAVIPGAHWPQFVLAWFKNANAPLLERRRILGRNAANGAAPP